MAEQSYTFDEGSLAAALRRGIEDAVDLVEVADPTGRLLWVNQAYEQATGYRRDELLGRRSAELLCDPRAAKIHEEFLRKSSDDRVWRGRIRGTARGGRPIVLDFVVTPVRDGGEISYYLGVHRDVTAEIHAQSELMQADRLSTVGQLAAGVAHEINNPLAYILANITYLSEALGARGSSALLDGVDGGEAEVTSALTDIEHGALRIRDIVRDLGAFSRPSEETAGPVDVRAVMDASVRMLVHELKHRARLRCEYGDVPPIWGDPKGLGQVFLNLVLNAAQAIGVGSVEANELRIETRTDEDGHVVVEVTDSGEGIPEEVLPRIFDPFFTTRPVGQGTGLGLAMAHRIVSGLGGTLAVSSEVGVGTTFTVRLPPCPPALRLAPAAAEAAEAIWPRRGRLLVVDDEPGVLRAMRRMLSNHDLTSCTSGAEALALLRAGRYDLIFCDVMMPEVSGMELFRTLSREAPEVARRFVFMTGGAFTVDAQEFLASVENPMVEKPFSTRDLRALVERLLSAK